MSRWNQFVFGTLTILAVAGCQGMEWKQFVHPRKSGQRDPEDGTQHGLWRYWYDFDRQHPQAQGNWKKDRQDGQWRYWYESGQLEWEGGFAANRLDGLSTFWFEDGNTRSSGIYDAGLEEGSWSYWNANGELDQQGEFAAGVPTGRWTFWYADGKPKADGFRWNGSRVGVWRFWDRNAVPFEKTYPIPSDVQIAAEEWDGGTPKREGFVVRGGRQGRWTAWNENGTRRMSGAFQDGKPHGLWIAWAEDGSPRAAGRVEQGRIAGPWHIWNDGQCTVTSGDRFAQPSSVSSADAQTAGTLPIESLLAVWITDAAAPATGKLDARVAAGDPEPPIELVEGTERRPRVPLRAQPWTATEEENLDYLVTRYTKGAKSAKPPPGSRYGKIVRAAPKGDTKRAAELIGKPLPSTRFMTGEGESIDLNSLRGKKVVLVVLRGYAGMVCVYCTTQTHALAKAAPQFAQHNADVFVVYPGPEDGLSAFLEAYKSLSKGIAPPYKQLADPNFRLVDPLGLRGDLAIPATLVLDESGIVRWAYVGTSAEDRPGTDEIIQQLESMTRP